MEWGFEHEGLIKKAAAMLVNAEHDDDVKNRYYYEGRADGILAALHELTGISRDELGMMVQDYM